MYTLLCNKNKLFQISATLTAENYRNHEGKTENYTGNQRIIKKDFGSLLNPD